MGAMIHHSQKILRTIKSSERPSTSLFPDTSYTARRVERQSRMSDGRMRGNVLRDMEGTCDQFLSTLRRFSEPK